MFSRPVSEKRHSRQSHSKALEPDKGVESVFPVVEVIYHGQMYNKTFRGFSNHISDDIYPEHSLN